MDDELRSLAAVRAETFPATAERIRFYVWALWGLGAMVAIVTAFVVRAQIKFAEYDQIKDKRDTQISAIEHYEVTNDAALAQIRNEGSQVSSRVASNESKLGIIDPKVTEMWIMKENGISNKEWFERHYGAPAPNYPPRP